MIFTKVSIKKKKFIFLQLICFMLLLPNSPQNDVGTFNDSFMVVGKFSSLVTVMKTKLNIFLIVNLSLGFDIPLTNTPDF